MRVKTKIVTRYCYLSPLASAQLQAPYRKASVGHGSKVCACLRLAELKLEKQAEERWPRLGEGQQLLWLAYPGVHTAHHADCAQAA